MKTLKMSLILFNCPRNVVIIFLAFIVWQGKTLPERYEPVERRLGALEGERAELIFPYPCSSTDVILHRYDVPIYNANNPNGTPARYRIITNRISIDNCSLHLVIDSVSRKDSDWYVLFSNDVVGGNIKLDVDYNPGMASCQLGSVLTHGEWIKLECGAEEGTIAGEFLCYQGGVLLPYLTSPQSNNGIITQVILARYSGYVFCCSSVREITMDMCSCKDWGWNFTNNSLITYTHPCTSGPSTQSTVSSDMYEGISASVLSPNLTTQPTKMALYVVIAVMTVVLTTITIIMIVACAYVAKYKREAQQKNHRKM